MVRMVAIHRRDGEDQVPRRSRDLALLFPGTPILHENGFAQVTWNDPDLGIDWGAQDPVLSPKDKRGVRFRDAETFA